MCTYSQGVWEEGVKRGSILRAVDDVKRVMSSLGFTLDRALEALQLTHEEREEARRQCAEWGLEP